MPRKTAKNPPKPNANAERSRLQRGPANDTSQLQGEPDGTALARSHDQIDKPHAENDHVDQLPKAAATMHSLRDAKSAGTANVTKELAEAKPPTPQETSTKPTRMIEA